MKDLDSEGTGHIAVDQLLPYINDSQGKDPQKQNLGIAWPEWVLTSGKVFMAKQVIAKIIECVEQQNIPPAQAFKIFDTENNGHVEAEEFGKILMKLAPTLSKEEAYVFSI